MKLACIIYNIFYVIVASSLSAMIPKQAEYSPNQLPEIQKYFQSVNKLLDLLKSSAHGYRMISNAAQGSHMILKRDVIEKPLRLGAMLVR